MSPLLAIAALLVAAALGAGHALTPGHGKTLMAAYLVGTRGTARQALGLGLTVSVTHTAGILALAVAILAAESAFAPDVVVRARAGGRGGVDRRRGRAGCWSPSCAGGARPVTTSAPTRRACPRPRA